MDNSKLVILLKTLDSKELRAFKDFVASPFFNKNEELILFYAYLKKIAPEFPLKKIQREAVYKAVFPQHSYDEKHLNYLMSFLLKLAEQFIGYQKYTQDGILPEYHQLAATIDRDLEKSYANIYSKTQQKLHQKPHRGHNFYYQRYLLSSIANTNFLKKKIRKYDKNIQEASDNFDVYYLCKKLKYACEILDRQKTLSVKYELKLIEELSVYLAQQPHDTIPHIAIYHQIYLTLTQTDGDKHFVQLKKLLQENGDKIELNERKQMYYYALNFCVRATRHNEEKYLEESLELYLNGIKSGLLFENNHLSPWTFKNTVKAGLRLKRYDWTEQFILRYAQDIAEEFRMNALNYNLADLHYYKKDFQVAQDYLQKVAFTDIFYTLNSKMMLLKIYYETNEEEALYSLVASFRVFLKRNKLISKTVRDAYLNFIKMLQQLMKRESKSLATLKQSMTNLPALTSRNWLLQQIQKIK